MKTIAQSIKLVGRIQADLRKEASRHRMAESTVAAADCEEQVEGLSEVIRILKSADQLRDALNALAGN